MKKFVFHMPEKRLRKQVNENPKFPHREEGRMKRGNLLFSEIVSVRTKELQKKVLRKEEDLLPWRPLRDNISQSGLPWGKDRTVP